MDPKPRVEILFGLTPIDAKVGFLYETSVHIQIIKNFKLLKKGTLVFVRIFGVRNPPTTGITNYFEMETKTK